MGAVPIQIGKKNYTVIKSERKSDGQCEQAVWFFALSDSSELLFPGDRMFVELSHLFFGYRNEIY